MTNRNKLKILWGIIVVLVVFNAWSWWHHFSVKEEYRRELVDVIQDAYRRGAYPPDHPFYQQAREIELLRQMWENEKQSPE